MNILVVGAGAIGSLIGGRLTAAGHTVTLKDPIQVKVDALKANGLKLHWPDGSSQVVHPGAIVSLDELTDLPSIDLVLITVKSFDTEAAVSELVNQLTPETRIMSLQNGVGNEDILLKLLPAQPMLAGSITLPVAVPGVGEIAVTKDKGGIGLSIVTPGAKIDDVAVAFREAGFAIELYYDYRSMKWSKLAMNNVSNAIPAILDMPPADALENTDIFNLELASMRETFAVMKAQNIAVVGLPAYPVPLLETALRWLPDWLIRPVLRNIVAGGRGSKLPSLQLDMRSGRNQSEVNVLNKMVAQTGHEYGIPTPINQQLSDILNSIVKGEVSPAKYQRNPEALLRAIQKQT